MAMTEAKVWAAEQLEAYKEKEDEIKQRLNESMDRKRAKIRILRRNTVNYNIRFALFKWRMTTVFTRLIDELVTCYVDKDGFRVVLKQDISKLFLSNTVGQMQNSLDTNKVRLQQLQHELKKEKEEVFTIKKKFNEQVFE